MKGQQERCRSVGMRLLPITGVFILLVCGISFTFGNRQQRGENIRERARHFFLEGAVCDAEGKSAEAFEYYKKSFQTDSTYPDGRFAYGMMLAGLEPAEAGDESNAEEGLRLASMLVNKYPGDFFSGTSYAYLAGMLDTISETIRVFEALDSLYPSKTSSLLHLGEAYMAKGEVEKAVAALDKYERIEGMSPALTLRKVVYRLSNKDTVAVMSEVDRLVQSNPRNADFAVLKGRVLEYIDLPDSALYYFEQAERLDSTSGEIKQALAQSYMAKGDSLGYDRKMIESIMSEDLDLDSKLRITANYLQKIINDKSDVKRGDKIFATLQSQYPHDSDILFLSSRYNAAKGDFEKAIEDVSYAIDLDGQREELWQSKMLYEVNSKHPEMAMKTFEKGEKVMGGNVSEPLRLLYAAAAQEAGNIDAAAKTYSGLIKDIDQTLGLDSELSDKTPYRDLDYPTLNRLSVYYQMAGDAYYSGKPKRSEEAFRCYENSLFFNPENDLALNNYAYFMIEEEAAKPGTELFERAKSMSRKALDLIDNSSTYMDTYAWILFQGGEYEEARDYQNAAVEKMKEDGDETGVYYEHLGDILYKCDDLDGALENWKKAYDLEPSELLHKKIERQTYIGKGE